MLRLLLPPNLATAAPRDAIAVKIELSLDQAPPPAIIPALVLLQRWCGGAATPPPLVQLKRAQLRELIGALSGQAVFAWVNAPQTPLLWVGPRLRGVSEHLVEATPAPATVVPPYRPPGVTPRATPPPSRAAAYAPPTPMIVDGSEHFLAIALPSREHSGYAAALALVKESGFILEPANRKWWLRDRHKVLNFLATQGEALRSEYHADFTANFEKNTEKILDAEIECDVAETAGEFSLSLGLKAGRASEEQLRTALGAQRNYVEEGGRIYLLTPERLEKIARTQRALADSPDAPTSARRTHRVSNARILEVTDLLEEIAPNFQPPAIWKERSQVLRNLTELAPAPMPEALRQQLRPYQQVGTAWLWHLLRHELGGILADEMGLGKTLQAIALLSAVKAAATQAAAGTEGGRSRTTGRPRPAAEPQPSLVVCPASLVENWRREVARFAPELRVFVHHGDQRIRDVATASGYDLILTSYGTLIRDRELFAAVDLACLFADEAQHAKNRRSQNAQSLRAMHARGRFLLTGTPIENSLEDLRALFEILMPGYVEKIPTGTRGEERTWFDDRLRAKTAPYILRRTKRAVAPELPDKIEQVLYCEPTREQAALYREWQERSERELLDLETSGAKENTIRFATLTQLLRLRQICCDPRLVAPGAEAGHSAKLEIFRELLAEAIDDGHRILVFSQFTSLLGLLREEMEAQALPFCYLDGGTPQKARQQEVDRFNQTPDIPVFLISLKAGGTGLNLTGADTVIHFDPWWNPAAEAQATDRAHRIGQTRVVTSYKIICTGSVEEKVLQLQQTKRDLLADVFEASDEANAKLSLADLKSLLSR